MNTEIIKELQTAALTQAAQLPHEMPEDLVMNEEARLIYKMRVNYINDCLDIAVKIEKISEKKTGVSDEAQQALEAARKTLSQKPQLKIV